MSPQSLSEAHRRLAAAWAADCAERVLTVFEVEAPDDVRPRELIARARAFAQGDLGVAVAIRLRMDGGVPADCPLTPAATAAARSAGQAAGVAHMGAHALGAAGYAAKAVALAAAAGRSGGSVDDALSEEVGRQLAAADRSPGLAAALRTLPALGTHRSGPLGPGLLASGLQGRAIEDLQARLAAVRSPSDRT